jgi:uncharacterized Zn finger protein
MSDTIPLRPCPWCGPAHQHRVVALLDRFDGGHIAYVHCERCGAGGPSEYHETEAVALREACNAWNGLAAV